MIKRYDYLIRSINACIFYAHYNKNKKFDTAVLNDYRQLYGLKPLEPNLISDAEYMRTHGLQVIKDLILNKFVV